MFALQTSPLVQSDCGYKLALIKPQNSVGSTPTRSAYGASPVVGNLHVKQIKTPLPTRASTTAGSESQASLISSARVGEIPAPAPIRGKSGATHLISVMLTTGSGNRSPRAIFLPARTTGLGRRWQPGNPSQTCGLFLWGV